MNRSWLAISACVFLTAACTSTQRVTNPSAEPESDSATTFRDVGEIRVVDWTTVPSDRLDVTVFATCSTVAEVGLPDGTTVAVKECTGVATMPADFHVAEGWARSSGETITDVVRRGDIARLWIDGQERSSPGYFDSDSLGRPVAYSVWIFQGLSGTHQVKVVWYRQGVVVMTVIITVTISTGGQSGNGQSGNDQGNDQGNGQSGNGQGNDESSGDIPAPFGAGEQVAFNSNEDGDDEIYVIDLATGHIAQLTNNHANDVGAAWDPIRDRIVFASDRDGNWELYSMNTDGSGQRRLTFTDDIDEQHPSFRPDGRYIVYDATGADDADIYMWDITTRSPWSCTDDPAEDVEPHFAVGADGYYIVFSTYRRGNWDVYVSWCTELGADEGPLTSTSGGLEGYGWQNDSGDALLYHGNADGAMDVYIQYDGGRAVLLGDPDMVKVLPAWSSDFSLVVCQAYTDRGTEIWIIDLDTENSAWIADAGTTSGAYPALRPTYTGG